MVKAHLEKVPSGETIDKNIGFWPESIGIPDGASSNRIMIEIGIIHFQNRVRIKFGSIL